MLKFVTTKPPRGRSSSGSATPDRDLTKLCHHHQHHHQYRSAPHDAVSFTASRGHYSPSVSRRQYYHFPLSSSGEQCHSQRSPSSSPTGSGVSPKFPVSHGAGGGPLSSLNLQKRREYLVLGPPSPPDAKSFFPDKIRDRKQPRIPHQYHQEQLEYQYRQPFQEKQQQRDVRTTQRQSPLQQYYGDPNYATLKNRPGEPPFPSISKDGGFPLGIEGLYDVTKGRVTFADTTEHSNVLASNDSDKRHTWFTTKTLTPFQHTTHTQQQQQQQHCQTEHLTSEIAHNQAQVHQTIAVRNEYTNEDSLRFDHCQRHNTKAPFTRSHSEGSPAVQRKHQPSLSSLRSQSLDYQQDPSIVKIVQEHTDTSYPLLPPSSEQQVMTTCVPQVGNELSSEAINKNDSSARSVGMTSHSSNTMPNSTRPPMSRNQEQAQMDGALSLDVVYITERIISMTFPSEGHDTTYSFNLREVVRMLKTKHGDNYLILNLSEKRQDLTKANLQVKDFGWPDHMAPPLERLCSLCKAIDSWLNADMRNVVVLHCKGGRSRIASVIAAYMHYSNICASADQAQDRFAMKRFYDDELGAPPLPSQRRYVRYFSGLLSGAIKINSNPLYLHHILIHGAPNFDTKGGCRPFIKVYQGMQPIFTSGVYNVTDNMQKVCISISPGIPLRGDILVKCYHKKNRGGQREVMWQCQYHTCAISDNSLIFSKHELDDAVMDPRFPDNGKVEFVFGPSSDVLVSVSGFKSDVTVPVDDNEQSLARSDSYENFNRVLEAVDGHAGHNAGFNTNSHHYTGSATTNINNRIDPIVVKSPPSYAQIQSSSNHNTNSSRRSVQTLEERTQLDELLSDLLSEQAYVSPRSPRSFQTAVQSQQTSVAPSSNSPNNMSGGAKTLTTSTRNFTSYSSTDAHRNPDKVILQRADVSYKVPGQGEKTDHYTIAADPTLMLDTSRPSHQYQQHKSIPNNAFSYTAGLSNAHQSNSQRSEVMEHEIIRSPMLSGSLQSPPQQVPRQPYRPEYNGGQYDTTPSSFSYSSLDGDTNAWLQQQQQKLKNFKDGRDPSGRTEQEKCLVNELRFAQNKYYTRSTQSEEEERAAMDVYNRQALHNGPVTPERVTQSFAAPRVTETPWEQQYNTSYNSSYVESHSYDTDKRSNKPPPSPTMQRSLPQPPARSSSKDYIRTLSGSTSSLQQPLRRQQSDTAYDRNVEHIIPRSYGSTHSTPPHSPRAMSPSGPHNITTYTQYRTLEREEDMQRAKRVKKQETSPPQPPPQPLTQPPTQVNHHYITEVFVHRSDMNKDKAESSTQLNEPEKNLEAATQSIKAKVQQEPPPKQQKQVIKESMQQSLSESRQYQQYAEPKPEPRIKEIEEDRIMLRPIGPGMQTLEPESAHTGTLGRPTTPGFPTASITPGFSTAPVGPPMFQPVQQQQTIQHQQFQQQYHTSNNGQPNSLHIDVSPKMMVAPRSPSAGSPPSPGNLNTLHQQLSTAHSMSGSVISPGPHSMTGQSSPSVYLGLSRRGSLSSLADSEMVHATPKFVKDTSKYWYKPHISRDDAIHMLKDKAPGTFVIRDSNSFPGAFGLALKVATLPPNVQAKPSGDPMADLVRHFLIEPTPKGVRLRGCSNEPVFGSLAAMVYQHSMTPLALPCKLALPEGDVVDGMMSLESPMSATELNSATTLLAQGAACNVMFINSVDLESLTGPQAVAKAIKMTFEHLVQGRTTVVHFKVSNQGITLTDNNRKLFFRRHYPVSAVTYCGMDPQDRRWKREIDAPGVQGDARLFGFVARKQGSANENTCHLFAELDPEQPASAIVNFVTKVMIGQSKVKS